ISTKNYETIGGKDSAASEIKLGKWKTPAMLATMFFIFTVSVLPVILLIWQTLMLKDGDYSLGNMTLHYWIGDSNPDIANGYSGVLKNSSILGSLKNSVFISVKASIIKSLIEFVIVFIFT